MKKFYTMVTHVKEADGFAVHLDGRPVKTPSGYNLTVPDEKLARLIAAEWIAQDKEIWPDTMPLTQLANTACDRVKDQRAEMETALNGYFETDLLCYRTDRAGGLAERQAATWNPVLDWFENRYGVGLETTTAIAAITQKDEAYKAVADELKSYDDWQFTLAQLITGLSGSILLALAFVDGALSADDVFAAMFVEELYKADIYDEAEHGSAPDFERKVKDAKRDLVAAEIIRAQLC